MPTISFNADDPLNYYPDKRVEGPGHNTSLEVTEQEAEWIWNTAAEWDKLQDFLASAFGPDDYSYGDTDDVPDPMDDPANEHTARMDLAIERGEFD